MNAKTRVKILTDPVYGPHSLFFWPGTVLHAQKFIFYDRSIDCRSTKDFLENYDYSYSGVQAYIENTKNPKQEYIDELYQHFHKLYDKIQCWPSHTFFVSALYRVVFDEIFPYQSKWYELIKDLRLNEVYLSKGLSDENYKAINDGFLLSVEEILQDKEIDKVGRRISNSTWRQFSRILRDPNLDPLVYQELVRLGQQYFLH